MSSVAIKCLPAAVMLWAAPAPARMAVRVAGSGASFLEVWRNPRKVVVNKPEVVDLLARIDAIHANAQEGLPIFFGAVLTALVVGVPNAEIDAAAVTYVMSRLVYSVVYLFSTPKLKFMGPLRTLTFAVGLNALFQLFFKAVKMRK